MKVKEATIGTNAKVTIDFIAVTLRKVEQIPQHNAFRFLHPRGQAYYLQ